MIPPTNRCLAIAVAALVVGCGESTGPDDLTFEWRGVIPPASRIEILGVRGSIRAFPAAAAANRFAAQEAVVTATKEGQRSSPYDVDIAVVTHAGGLTICAVYPGSGDCRPADVSQRTAPPGNDVEVTFTVAVPTGISVTLVTETGNIEAESLDADVFAASGTGDLLLSTSGVARGSVESGTITASIGAVHWRYDLGFSATTGDITVHLSPYANTDAFLSTGFGTVTSDFALAQIEPGRVEGTINGGGRELHIRTLTGNVALLQRPPGTVP